jgi:hypothetical protein
VGWDFVLVGPDLTITGPEQLVSPGAVCQRVLACSGQGLDGRSPIAGDHRGWAQIRDDFLANELRQRPTLTVTYAVRCNMSCPADTRNSGTSTPPLQQSFEGGSTLAYETR